MDKQDYKNAREFLRKIQSAMSKTDYSKGLHELTETADNFHTCFECLDIAEGADKLNARIKELEDIARILLLAIHSKDVMPDILNVIKLDSVNEIINKGNKNDQTGNTRV